MGASSFLLHGEPVRWGETWKDRRPNLARVCRARARKCDSGLVFPWVKGGAGRIPYAARNLARSSTSSIFFCSASRSDRTVRARGSFESMSPKSTATEHTSERRSTMRARLTESLPLASCAAPQAQQHQGDHAMEGVHAELLVGPMVRWAEAQAVRVLHASEGRLDVGLAAVSEDDLVVGPDVVVGEQERLAKQRLL
jgi:hypothetical protein